MLVLALGQFVIELDLHDWTFAQFNRPLCYFGQDKEGPQRALPGLRADGHGRMATILGGLSIPYVTIPTNNRAGITMGGTRYFMVSSLLEKRLGVVVRAALQFTEEYGRRQGKGDEQHYGVYVFLTSRIGRLSTGRGRMLVHWQEPCQSPGNSRIVQSWRSTDGQSSDHRCERLSREDLRQSGKPGGLVPGVYTKSRQRRDHT